MRINCVELENIRSYEGDYQKNRVEFPEGSVLLAGDIGRGKSSLLLAIEFALFGIKRGELSGGSLLRRGTKSGGVKLNFTLLGKDITIERRLRRTARSIKQDSGTIMIDGVRREGSPEELKARILELLGYPQELLKKQKSLIYRYTVYTPQEQMKRIVRANKEDRLDTLRKVFGVDRYKTIRENAGEFLTAVRQKRRELRVVFRDLDEKKEERMREKKELNKIKKLLQRLFEKKGKIEAELRKWRKKKQRIERKIELYNKYDKGLGEERQNERNLRKQLEGVRGEIEGNRKKVKEIDELRPPTSMSEKTIKRNTQHLDREVEKCLKDNRGINSEIDALLKKKEDFERLHKEKGKEITLAEERMKSFEENLDKLIKAENKCPVCGKDLDEKHRQEKIREYEEEIDRNRELSEKAKTDVERLTNLVAEMGDEINQKVMDVVGELRKKKESFENTLEELREYNEKLREKQRLKEEMKKDEERERGLITELSGVEKRIKELQKLLGDLKGVEKQKGTIEEKIENVGNRVTEAKEEVATQEANKSNLDNRLEEIKNEIETKENAKRFWNSLGEYAGWFEDYLMLLTATIERHFMLELRRQFDPLLKNWFNILIDDENLSVRIDDEFSPIIEQQGYEAEYENLSGGESASVALAYRLALNKVINTLVEDIRTRDLIILDEPTDGFSVNQLDKIRDVLEQLGIPQTIIVSHEPKIESYVENIIRIYKEGGVSRINQSR